MAGFLTIHSNGEGDDLKYIATGHSWIEYEKDGESEPVTYGTWGNNPTGEGNGLFKNLEKGKVGDSNRKIYINDEQEKVLNQKIKEYKDKGTNAWKPLHPCSSFAADVWKCVTGEKLVDRRLGISNPSTLKKSIQTANVKESELKNENNDKQWDSKKKLKEVVLPCVLRSSSR